MLPNATKEILELRSRVRVLEKENEELRTLNESLQKQLKLATKSTPRAEPLEAFDPSPDWYDETTVAAASCIDPEQ